jgi:branched-chain amino acid transport system permease protein
MTNISALRQSPALAALTRPGLRRAVLTLVCLVIVVGGAWVSPLSFVGDGSRAAEYALVGVSLVLLTGWVGQISLAQGSFVGVGAFVTALVFRKASIPFPLSLPFAVAASALAAVLLGVVALRVRGLYLAVATLIFAWMADAWLFSAQWFVGEGGSATLPTTAIGTKNTLTFFDLRNPRVFYLVAVAALALGLYVAANLRDSKTGRAFFAIRGSEVAAASLGIDVTRYKLLAFGISGALAGLAGHVQIVGDGSAVPVEFNFLTSLFYLSIVIVGGVASLSGVVAAGLLFSGLWEVFYRVSALNGYIDIVSAVLLLAVLLVYPGGLAAAGRALAQLVRPRLMRLLRVGVEPADEGAVVMKAVRGGAEAKADQVEPQQFSLFDLTAPAALPINREDRRPVLDASGITVRFGGLTAVDDVSLAVREGEIVGLIGPNGAGKTTLFNAIAGLNDPTTGSVHLFGEDVTGLPVHERAARGVGRTFQLIQLFPELNVFDNLLAATHLQNRTGFAHHVIVTQAALHAEERARARVREVVDRLDLNDVAYRTVSGLPFGVLRIVELARAMVTGAPFIMLDEPASGLDNAETDRLSRLLLELRSDLGLSVLLIEHDVAMVTSVSDYMYVINRGRLLAEGTPAQIQSSEEVIAAYLGRPAGEEAMVGA